MNTQLNTLINQYEEKKRKKISLQNFYFQMIELKKFDIQKLESKGKLNKSEKETLKELYTDLEENTSLESIYSAELIQISNFINDLDKLQKSI